MTSTPRPARAIADYPPVVVLLGGPSAEHDVSVVSGTAILDAVRSRGLRVQPVYVDLDGRWWWLPAEHARGDRPVDAYDDPAALGADGPFRVGQAIDRLATADPAPVVFVALHGPFGEDGVVQGLLESIDIAYTGAGVAASALGMDKALFKRLIRGLGLPVADWREIHQDRWASDRAGVLAELQAFATANDEARLMVKPARLGSSVGMSIAHDASERAAAIDEAFRFDTLVLVERYLPGVRELEVAIIGNAGPVEDFGPGEVVSGREFYDYVAKYTPGMSETSTHAELEPAQRALARKYARDAYRAVGAEGFGRIDFLLSGDRLYVSELNTIPGFTPISLFPTLPADGGYDFGAVCLRVIDLALERHAGRVGRHLRDEDLPR